MLGQRSLILRAETSRTPQNVTARTAPWPHNPARQALPSVVRLWPSEDDDDHDDAGAPDPDTIFKVHSLVMVARQTVRTYHRLQPN